jgi:putative ABC transport system permease protein
MRTLPFDYAVRNLGRSRSRLALSVLGSLLVVTLMIAAGGFVRGMETSLRSTGSPGNVMILGAGSEESIERSEILASSPGVIEASIDGIRTEAGVPYVSAEVHVQLLLSAEGQQSPPGPVMVRGITPGAMLVHDQVQILEGRLPSSGANEVMVGRMAASMIGSAAGLSEPVRVGQALTIDKRPWTVVGVFTAPGTVIEGEVWAPLSQVMEATKRITISCVIITLDPELAEVADVEIFAKTRPDLELFVMREMEYYGKLATFFAPIRMVAWVTAGLIAIGGLFGGLNTMYAAFASRIREIGTLRALGFRRRAIVWSLVQESVLATTVGALGAAALGLFVLDGVAVRFSMGSFGLNVDAGVLGVGLAAGLALGVLGALPPAARCLRMAIPVALKAV